MGSSTIPSPTFSIFIPIESRKRVRSVREIELVQAFSDFAANLPRQSRIGSTVSATASLSVCDRQTDGTFLRGLLGVCWSGLDIDYRSRSDPLEPVGEPGRVLSGNVFDPHRG